MENAQQIASHIKVAELQVKDEKIDPTKAPIKRKLLAKLGMQPTAEIVSVSSHGFNNSGLWTIGDRWMMKLVRNERREGEKFEVLAEEFPSIVSDSLLTFPSYIVRCKTSDKATCELIVMPKASGVCLHDYVVAKARAEPGISRELGRIFENVGVLLAKFHANYKNKQHSDFQPANILYDENSHKITFIDLADIGRPTAPPGSDFAQFTAAIRALYASRGPAFAHALEQYFMNGYRWKP
jgi:serine/threonine protein kinase